MRAFYISIEFDRLNLNSICHSRCACMLKNFMKMFSENRRGEKRVRINYYRASASLVRFLILVVNCKDFIAGHSFSNCSTLLLLFIVSCRRHFCCCNPRRKLFCIKRQRAFKGFARLSHLCAQLLLFAAHANNKCSLCDR